MSISHDLLDETDSIDGGGCPHCGAVGEPSAEAWCQQCGYYPALGTCIELTQGAIVDDEEDEERQPQPQNLIEHLMQMPAWTWQMIGCGVSGVFISLAIRLLTQPRTDLRLGLAFAQLGLACLVFAAVQAWTLTVALREDTKFGPFDYFLRPLLIWFPTFAELPEKRSRVLLALASISSFLAVLVVSGGIPYYWIWEYEPAKTKKPNLLKAVVENAGKFASTEESEAEGLEDAIDEFAGKADDLEPKPSLVDGLAAQLRDSLNGPEDRRKEQVDCLIVGYRLFEKGEREGRLKTVLVAYPVENRLRIVAMVREGLQAPLDEAEPNGMTVGDALLVQLLEIKRQKAAVHSPYTAHWVEPVLACRVKCVGWVQKIRLDDPAFVEVVKDFR